MVCAGKAVPRGNERCMWCQSFDHGAVLSRYIELHLRVLAKERRLRRSRHPAPTRFRDADRFEKFSGSFDKHMANEQNPHHYVFLLLHLALQDPSVDLSNVSWPLVSPLPPFPQCSMPHLPILACDFRSPQVGA